MEPWEINKDVWSTWMDNVKEDLKVLVALTNIATNLILV